MRKHTATTVTELTYEQLVHIAFVNNMLLHAGVSDEGLSVTYGIERGPMLDWIPSCVSIFGSHIDVVDGQPLYIGGRDHRQFVVHGQSEGRHYDDVSWLVSRDSHIGYHARDGVHHLAIVDGVEGKHYHGLWPHAFIGGKMLYAADLNPRDPNLPRRKGYELLREAMVFGVNEGLPYKAIMHDNGMEGTIVDGKPLYAVHHVGGTCSIVHGSREGKRYQGGISHLQWADGASLYTACNGTYNEPDSYVLVRGDTELAHHPYIDDPSWVNDRPLYHTGNSVVFGNERREFDFHVCSPRIIDGVWQLHGQTGGYVGDDRPHRQFWVHGDWRSDSFYAAFGNPELINGRLMFMAELDPTEWDEDGDPIQRFCIVHGHEQGRVYRNIDDLHFTIGGPIYRADDAEGQRVVIGADEGPIFDAIFSLQFDAKRGIVTYGAIKDRTVYGVAVAL